MSTDQLSAACDKSKQLCDDLAQKFGDGDHTDIEARIAALEERVQCCCDCCCCQDNCLCEIKRLLDQLLVAKVQPSI